MTSISLTSQAGAPVAASRQLRAVISCQRSPRAVWMRATSACLAGHLQRLHQIAVILVLDQAGGQGGGGLRTRLRLLAAVVERGTARGRVAVEHVTVEVIERDHHRTVQQAPRRCAALPACR